MQTPKFEPLFAARNLDFVFACGLLGEDDGPLDLTDATLAMEVRQYDGQPGAALATLAEVMSDTAEGIYVNDATGGIITIIIAQATLAAFPGGPAQDTPPNKPDVFRYDLVIVRPLPAEPLAMAGTFTLNQGVTA